MSAILWCSFSNKPWRWLWDDDVDDDDDDDDDAQIGPKVNFKIFLFKVLYIAVRQKKNLFQLLNNDHSF
jgi:hypothetical protein